MVGICSPVGGPQLITYATSKYDRIVVFYQAWAPEHATEGTVPTINLDEADQQTTISMQGSATQIFMIALGLQDGELRLTLSAIGD